MQTLERTQDIQHWLHRRGVQALWADSRRVGAGDGFIAWPGGVHDGRAFVAQALAQGAQACLVEQDGLDAHWPWVQADDERVLAVPGLKAASGPIAAAFYQEPSQALRVVAYTGTNGKTSSAWWCAHALEALGQSTRLVGTLGMGAPHALDSTGMTTPDPVRLQAALRAWVDDAANVCVMEASSIGLAEHRLDGTHIEVAVLTNFTQDHLDYHGTMAAYWDAKQALFDWPGLRAAVVNLDDPQGQALWRHLANRPALALWTYGAPERGVGEQHLSAQGITAAPEGMRFEVCAGAQRWPFPWPVVGRYNIDNLLGVLATLCALGFELADAVKACAALPPVPGRMQGVGGVHQPRVVVDYAHTPDAVAQALQALRPLAQARQGQLMVVLGCGGDRDRSKRPAMAAAAQAHADGVWLTSDNPRSEDPLTILEDMQQGLRDPATVSVIVSRAQAITQAVTQAQAQDVILIAGKGHEDYQEIQGVREPFSDLGVAQAALQLRRAHG